MYLVYVWWCSACLCFFAGNMQIFVKIAGKIVTLDVLASDTINDVKTKLQDKIGIPYYAQKLMFAGYQLNNYHTVTDCGIKKEATLHLLPELKLKGLLLSVLYLILSSVLLLLSYSLVNWIVVLFLIKTHGSVSCGPRSWRATPMSILTGRTKTQFLHLRSSVLPL